MADFYHALDANARLHVVVNQTAQSIALNTSTISAQLYLERTAGTGRWSGYTNNSWSMTIDGQVIGGSGTYDLRGGGSQLLLNGTFTVAHNSDGTKTIGIGSAFSDPHGTVASGSFGDALALTTIPRYPGAPTFNSIDNVTAVALRANFTAPASAGGSAITGYTVQVSTSADFSGAVTATGASSPITKTGLTPSTLHYVRVKATNAQGDGPWSATLTASTAAAGAPHLDVIRKWDGTGFFVLVSPPFSVGAVTSYTILRSVVGPGAPADVSTVTAAAGPNFDALVLAPGQTVTYRAFATVGGVATGQSASVSLDYAAVVAGAPFWPIFDGATQPRTPLDTTETATIEWTNLVTNPSAETVTTGYTAIPGTTGVAALTSAAPSTVTAYGTKVLKCTWSTASTAAGGGTYYDVPVTALATYSFAVGHIKSSILNRLKLRVEWRTAIATISNSDDAEFVAAAGTIYTKSLAGLVAPATATVARITVLSVAGTSYANWSIASYLELDGVWAAAQATVAVTPDLGDLTGMPTLSGRRPRGWRSFAEGAGALTLAGAITQVPESLALSTETGDFDVMAVFASLQAAAGMRVGTTADTTSGFMSDVFATINYYASIKVKVDVATRMACEIEWYASNGTLVGRSTGSDQLLVANTTTILEVNDTAPEGAVYAAVVSVDVAGTGWAAGSLRFVGAVMLSASAKYPYFDGDSAPDAQYDYEWMDAENASPSLRVSLSSSGSGNALQDPDEDPLPAPPSAPVIEESTILTDVVWRRYVAAIPVSEVRLWIKGVPTLSLFAIAEAEHEVRIRYWRNPNDVDPTIWTDTGIEPESEQIISYIPGGTTFVIDGVAERAYVRTPATVDNPEAILAANHLLYGEGGGPATWPELDCETPYILTLDVPVEATPGNISMFLNLTDRML